MGHRQLATATPALRVKNEPSLPVLTHGHSSALDHLSKAFAEARPVAMLIGTCESSAGYLIDRFLAGIDGDAAKVRITGLCSDAVAGMREVIEAVGFESEDGSHVDLENEFTSSLSYQRYHNRRTIICFEKTQNNAGWVLDWVRRLVELETREKFGLMVILSGRPGLNQLVSEPPFDVISAHAGQRIAHASLTLAETREYILREIEAADVADIAQVFEFDAITFIHELCAGVPDNIDSLCCKCIELADDEDAGPITTDLVNKADELLKRAPIRQNSGAEVGSVRVNGARPPIGRLIARMNGVIVKEQVLHYGHILIGRGKQCDIPVTHPAVSRRHALVVSSPVGVRLVDLSSKNGTFVGGRQIEQHALQNGDVIAVGNCTIAYIASDDRRD